MDPGFRAAPFRHRRDARILLACIRGGVTCTLCPASDEEAGSKDRARQDGQPGAVGRLLGAVRPGMVAVGHGMQEGSELGHERLDEERLRGDHACSGREGRRVRDGVEACITKGLELTASSVRCAPASGSSSGLALL